MLIARNANHPQQMEAAVITELSPKHTFPQIIHIRLSNGHTFIQTNAFLDCGSNTTLMRKDVAKRLNFEGKQKTSSVASALSRSHSIGSVTVSLDLSSAPVPGSTKISAWAVHNLKIPFNRYNVSKIKKIHPHRKDINLLVLIDSDVTLLIGTDYSDLFLHKDFRQGQNAEPKAVKATLDWILMGGSKSKEKRAHVILYSIA